MPSDSLRLLTRETRARFRERFGLAPEVLAAAPGRINIIGEHTDYNHGYALPMAVDRWCVAVSVPRDEPEIEIHSVQREHPARIALDGSPIERTREPAEAPWANALRGVIAGFLEHGVDVSGQRILIDSNIPPGSGLASSAAVAVAVATLLEATCHFPLDPLDLTLLCQKAEQEFAGVPCGVMDQYVSRHSREGAALLIDCESLTHRHVPLRDGQFTFLTFDSGVHHQLADGSYGNRRQECEDAAKLLGVRKLRHAQEPDLAQPALAAEPTLLARARHVVRENQRTLEAARLIAAGKWTELGNLMNQAHRSLADDFAVSCPEIETLVQLAQKIPAADAVLGARLTGGGFGGSVIYLVESARASEIAAQLTDHYRQLHPTASANSAGPIASQPGGGAHVLSGS